MINPGSHHHGARRSTPSKASRWRRVLPVSFLSHELQCLIFPPLNLLQESDTHVFSHLLLPHAQRQLLYSCFVTFLLRWTLQRLSPLPSPPIVPSQIKSYKAYDRSSKCQYYPVAVHRFWQGRLDQWPLEQGLNLQLSFPTGPHGPGSSESEACTHLRTLIPKTEDSV